jgi:hypothetical protein
VDLPLGLWRIALTKATWPTFGAMALFCFISLPQLSAQTIGKSHEDCLKLVPGDWGSNFGEDWKQHESVYWGCRLGASVETIKQWQQFSSGMIQDLIQVTIGKEQIVLIESMEGSAHCFEISALRKTPKGWESVWSPPSNPDSMDYCTLACPPVRIKASGKHLTLENPQTSDPKEDQTFSCKHLRWCKETYHWDGHTYQPAKVNSHSRTTQTRP